MAVSSPIKRHGGKAYLAQKIRALFPPHTRYCEPFFGSGAVLFSGDGEGVAEFANDLDDLLMDFWGVLTQDDLFDEWYRVVSCIPFGEPVFDSAKEYLRLTSKTHEERARRAASFFILNRQSRQALGKDFATPTTRLRRGMNEQVSAWLTAVEGLPEFHARLKRVEIRCQPAVDFIRELDTPDTLFYCDPPYMHETRSTTKEYGEHEMSEADHILLLGVLKRIAGKFALSGYRCPLYDRYESELGWRRVDFDLPNQASSAKTKERKTECVWTNF